MLTTGQTTWHHCRCGRSIPLRFDECKECEAGQASTFVPRQPAPDPPMTHDGDPRLLVARCARRGIPVGIVAHHGYLTLVRNLDDLEAARPNLCNAPTTESDSQ